MSQITKVLFPTDFSDHSNHALPYAVALAATYRAKLYVLHVITIMEHDPYDPQHTFPDIDTYRKKIEEGARAKAGQVIDQCQQGPGKFQVEKLIERGTAPYGNILDAAEREGIDLIILSTHGRSGLSHFLLGSVAEKVVRFAPCPVLVVKKHEHEFVNPETGLLQLKEILVPTDFSEASKTALRYGVSLAQQFGAALCLTHIIENRRDPALAMEGTETGQVGHMIETVQERLKEFASGEVPEDLSVTKVVLEGKAHEEINRLAHEQHVDLIIMGLAGYDEIGDYLIGSTTERTVRHAPCPVLVTH